MRFKHLFLTITLLSNLLLTGFAQEPILLEHGSGVRAVAFSPVNDNLLASAGENNTIKLWNLRRGTARTLKGHTDVVNSIAFSPNGRLLASVSHDRTIKLWNVHNQQNIATLREGTLFGSVAFSPDGKLLATAGWMHVKLWDVGRRVVVATLLHDEQVQTVAFSADGEFLAVGDSSREGSGTVKVWNIQEQQVIATLEDDLVFVRSVTFSSDDRYLASSHYNGEVKVWNVADWELLRTIPRAGDYDIAFSPNGKMIAGTGNGSVNIWWAEDGTNVAQLTGPDGWQHPVDFSHDGTSLAVGAEDGIVRIWRIDTSFADAKGDTVQILHIDTYFQELPRAHSVNGDNIPEPTPPPAVIRAFYELDPYYEQWINVRGLPVIAPAKVNPYAVKEAAWLIEKMIGHRPDVLRAMVSNKARFSVVAHTDIITEIPEYRDVGTPDFLAFWARGAGGSEGATVSSSEENILAFPGEVPQEYNVQIHEFAHGIHILGLNTLDPTFEERLQMTYEAAMKKGLWQGTYASSDIREYWAESTQAWFHHNTPGSFKNLDPIRHTTRQALKLYDPELAALLAEVYGDRQWRYTPLETRTHLPHLQGFNPQDSPIFEGWSELEDTYRQLKNPNSDGNGAWANLKLFDPNQLSHLTKSSVLGDQTTFVCVNLSQADVLLYRVYPDGTEEYWTRVPPDTLRVSGRVGINEVWLIKDANDRNLALFQTVEKAGRAFIGSPPRKTVEDVNSDGIVNILDLVSVSANFGQTGENIADVNGDGIVNIVDLVKVAGEMGTGAAAPASHPQTLEILTAADVQQWLTQAQHADLTDAISQRGILMLQQLLASLIPKETSLLPNYPNPFNPETWIPYQLSEPAAVTLHIYAVNGRLIRTLMLGHQPAGMYQSKNRAVYWDGRNQVGEQVASGVYFYTLTAGDFTATRKMLIRK